MALKRGRPLIYNDGRLGTCLYFDGVNDKGEILKAKVTVPFLVNDPAIRKEFFDTLAKVTPFRLLAMSNNTDVQLLVPKEDVSKIPLVKGSFAPTYDAFDYCSPDGNTIRFAVPGMEMHGEDETVKNRNLLLPVLLKATGHRVVKRDYTENDARVLNTHARQRFAVTDADPIAKSVSKLIDPNLEHTLIKEKKYTDPVSLKNAMERFSKQASAWLSVQAQLYALGCFGGGEPPKPLTVRLMPNATSEAEVPPRQQQTTVPDKSAEKAGPVVKPGERREEAPMAEKQAAPIPLVDENIIAMIIGMSGLQIAADSGFSVTLGFTPTPMEALHLLTKLQAGEKPLTMKQVAERSFVLVLK